MKGARRAEGEPVSPENDPLRVLSAEEAEAARLAALARAAAEAEAATARAEAEDRAAREREEEEADLAAAAKQPVRAISEEELENNRKIEEAIEKQRLAAVAQAPVESKPLPKKEQAAMDKGGGYQKLVEAKEVTMLDLVSKPNINFAEVMGVANREMTEATQKFTAASSKNTLLQSSLSSAKADLSKALTDKDDKLYKSALTKARFELAEKRGYTNEGANPSPDDIDKLNREAASIAKKRLEQLSGRCEESVIPFRGVANSFKALQKAHTNLETQAAKVKENKLKLDNLSNNLAETKEDIAEIQGQLKLKEGQSTGWAKFKAGLFGEKDRLALVQELEDKQKEARQYDKDLKVTANDYDKSKASYEKKQKEYDGKYKKQQTQFADSVGNDLAKERAGVTEENASKLAAMDAKCNAEKEKMLEAKNRRAQRGQARKARSPQELPNAAAIAGRVAGVGEMERRGSLSPTTAGRNAHQTNRQSPSEGPPLS